MDPAGTCAVDDAGSSRACAPTPPDHTLEERLVATYYGWYRDTTGIYEGVARHRGANPLNLLLDRYPEQAQTYQPNAAAIRALVEAHYPELEPDGVANEIQRALGAWRLDALSRGIICDDAAVLGAAGMIGGAVARQGGPDEFLGPDRGGGGGGFRGPAAKDFDWEHIIDHHAPSGSVAQQRRRQGVDNSLFENMSEEQIQASVKEAWRNRNRVHTQVDPATGETRILYRGKDSRSGYTIEMWYNQRTGIVETAYPVQ